MSIKEKMKKGTSVIGPFIKIPSPEIMEIIGLSGFDYVIIDCEHGPLDMLSAQNLIRAAKLRGMDAIVRVGSNDPLKISRALDIGADGVQIPQIVNKQDALDAVKYSKYSDMGERGVCKYVRAADYTFTEANEYFKKSNEEKLVIIHIEGLEGITNIDEILDVEGIDVIFIGPYDLSASMGLIGDVRNEKVQKELAYIVKKAKEKNKIIGTFADDIESAKHYRGLGIEYISYSVDVGIIANKFKEDYKEYVK